MTLDEYQKQAITTDSYGGGAQAVSSEAFIAKILGLCGESGEVAEKFKKIFRDKHGAMTENDKSEILKELGDVLPWRRFRRGRPKEFGQTLRPQKSWSD